MINVVDLMRLQPESEHPHGLADRDFDTLFTKDKPIIFAFHGYPWLIHRLTYRRTNHDQIHVRGFKENGTTTTPFDMVVLNDLDRFHLVGDVIDRVPSLGSRAAHSRQWLRDRLLDHKMHIERYGEDMRTIKDAVHTDKETSRSVYDWVVELCRKLGADVKDLVPFDKYAQAALSLQSPSSAARALANGAPNIERVDRLVQTIAKAKGMQNAEVDKTVALVDEWVAKNRAKAK